MKKRSSNITWHERRLTRDDYRRRNGHDPLVLWFTGHSGSGKSTLVRHDMDDCCRVVERGFARAVATKAGG